MTESDLRRAYRDSGIQAALCRRGAPAHVYNALLARYPNVWPSLAQTAKDTGKDRSTVRRALRVLEQCGLITRERRPGTGRYHHDTSVVHFADITSESTARDILESLEGRGTDTPRGIGDPRGVDTPRGRGVGARGVGACTPPKDIREDTKKDISIVASDSWTQAQQHFTSDALDNEAFRQAWEDWTAHRKQLRKPLTAQAIKLQIRKCEQWGSAESISAIEHAISAGYQGLFPPSDGRRRKQTPEAFTRTKVVLGEAGSA